MFIRSSMSVFYDCNVRFSYDIYQEARKTIVSHFNSTKKACMT